MFDCVGIAGVGMIGASIGLALKARRLANRVLGIGRRPESLAEAQRMGAIDEAIVAAPGSLDAVELLVLCAPVDVIGDLFARLAPHLRVGAIVTDAGSTKSQLVRDIESRQRQDATLAARPFVGSHPLAGSEKQGASAGSATLFEGRTCVITPTPTALPDAVAWVSAFWRAIGMRVLEKSPEEHDRILARTSHLPHLTATALTLVVGPDEWPFTGTGFRDATRIAAGDPHLWTAIFRHNRQAVLEAISQLDGQLALFRDALERPDDALLMKLFTDGKRNRDRLGN